MSSWQMFILGLLGLVGALVGAYAIMRKIGPEVNKLQIDSSTALVAMARENAELQRADAADVRARNMALEGRVNEQGIALAQATERINALMLRLEEAEERARAEVAAVRRENVALRLENQDLRHRLGKAEERITELTATR